MFHMLHIKLYSKTSKEMFVSYGYHSNRRYISYSPGSVYLFFNILLLDYKVQCGKNFFNKTYKNKSKILMCIKKKHTKLANILISFKQKTKWMTFQQHVQDKEKVGQSLQGNRCWTVPFSWTRETVAESALMDVCNSGQQWLGLREWGGGRRGGQLCWGKSLRGGQYLVQDVVALLAGGDLDEPVEALCGLLDQHVPTAGVVPLTAQSHHLRGETTRNFIKHGIIIIPIFQ